MYRLYTLLASFTVIIIPEKEKTSHTNSGRHECQILLTEMDRLLKWPWVTGSQSTTLQGGAVKFNYSLKTDVNVSFKV